jgi:hypothetical protein
LQKLEAMVSLGMANSRMRDFYDTWVLLQQFELNDQVLAQAIRATFERRGTRIPSNVPLGLTDEFAGDPDKQRQWSAFLRRSGLAQSHELRAVAETLRDRLCPLIARPPE